MNIHEKLIYAQKFYKKGMIVKTPYGHKIKIISRPNIWRDCIEIDGYVIECKKIEKGLLLYSASNDRWAVILKTAVNK